MLGNIQRHAPCVGTFVDFADRCHGDSAIVSRRVEGDLHRADRVGIAGRARRFARWLDDTGIGHGQRAATLAWNGYRHLELYYGVSALGRIPHTRNPRLPPAQLERVINDAWDQVVCFDGTFLPLVEAIQLLPIGVTGKIVKQQFRERHGDPRAAGNYP
jgi:long-subunit acyl-CoA synthetase (AMP-forming)